MLSSLGSVALRLGAWSYLPDFATQKLLSFYYHILSSRGCAVPRRGTPLWQTHYRSAYSVSVLAYLLYNFIEAARSTPLNFYQILGVLPDVDDSALRSSYRAFAKRYHPDRAGPASENSFMTIQNAYEALKHPMKRFAYERFGPDALNWRECSTPMDYLKRGIMQSSGFYIVSGGILILMSLMMKRSRVEFWRYVLLVSLMASELCLIAGPRDYGFLGVLFPDRVAFQHVLFLHQMFVFLSVALSRVIPVLFPEEPVIRADRPNTYAQWLQRLEALEMQVEAEVLRLIRLELHAMSNTPTSLSTSEEGLYNIPPCNPPPEVQETLTREMEDIVFEHLVRAEPPLRPLWDEAVRRRWEQKHCASASSLEGIPPCKDQVGGERHADKDVAAENLEHPSMNNCLRLPSPAPTLSPEVRSRKLSGSVNDCDELEEVQEEGRKTPTGKPVSPPVSPKQLIGTDNELVLDHGDNNRAFIRVTGRRSLSP